MDKAIQHKKEHRKEYRGAKAIDTTCRNHGSCSYCSENRQIQKTKVNERAKEMLTAYNKGED